MFFFLLGMLLSLWSLLFYPLHKKKFSAIRVCLVCHTNGHQPKCDSSTMREQLLSIILQLRSSYSSCLESFFTFLPRGILGHPFEELPCYK